MDILDDGHGNLWEAACPECGERMQIMRPGEVQCPNEPHEGESMKPKRSWPKASGTYDDCDSPPEAWEALRGHVPPEWTIWETAVGAGLLKKYMQADGRSVAATGPDFLTIPIMPGVDCIITNPPYSIKYAWIARCREHGLPTALLLPVESLGAASLWDAWPDPSVMIVTPRLNFRMPKSGWGGSGAQFPTAWFCWGMPVPRLSRVTWRR